MPVANVQLLSLTFDVVHSVAMVHALFARRRRQALCRIGDVHSRLRSTVLSLALARHGRTVVPASNHLPADWHASAAIHAHCDEVERARALLHAFGMTVFSRSIDRLADIVGRVFGRLAA